MPGYHLPLYAGVANATYARHGLDVQIVDAEPGAANVLAVADGRYDACLTSAGHFLRACAAREAVGARFVFMVARRTHLAAFTREDGPKTFADLDGATFLGTRDDSFGREYLALLSHLGFAPPPTADLPYDRWFRGLADGAGDVAVDFLDLSPRVERATARTGVGLRALPFFEAGIVTYGSGLVVSLRLIQEKPDVVQRLARAYREALLDTRADPEPAFSEMLTRFRGLDRDRTIAGFRAGEPLVFFDDELGAMDAELWQRTIEHNARTHGTPRVAAASVYDDGFVAASAAA
jgi:ABC-type nitrate/sulfonate/bicarbonate transport system substrate-binding protein